MIAICDRNYSKTLPVPITQSDARGEESFLVQSMSDDIKRTSHANFHSKVNARIRMSVDDCGLGIADFLFLFKLAKLFQNTKHERQNLYNFFIRSAG